MRLRTLDSSSCSENYPNLRLEIKGDFLEGEAVEGAGGVAENEVTRGLDVGDFCKERGGG